MAQNLSRLCAYTALTACLLSVHCLPLIQGGPALHVRVVHVKAVADPSFATTALWRHNVENLIETASEYFRSYFDVAFVLDTIVVWDAEASECHETMFTSDCLVRSVEPGDADIVVFFSKERDRGDFGVAGRSLCRQGYVLVTQADWVHMEGGYEWAFYTLVHELGHLFGAFHVEQDDAWERWFVMSPRWPAKLLVKEGTRRTLKMPEWHPVNRHIVSAMRNRPFRRTEWTVTHWDTVERAYQAMRDEHCRFRVTDDGKLADHEFNDMRPLDYYIYLTYWAMLGGGDSLALMYLDSMKTVLTALRATCRACGNNCQARVCRGTGRGEERIEKWYNRRLAYYHLRRAHVLMEFGRETEAREEFESFLRLRPGLRVGRIARYRASLEFTRERARRERGEATEKENGNEMEEGVGCRHGAVWIRRTRLRYWNGSGKNGRRYALPLACYKQAAASPLLKPQPGVASTTKYGNAGRAWGDCSENGSDVSGISGWRGVAWFRTLTSGDPTPANGDGLRSLFGAVTHGWCIVVERVHVGCLANS